MTIQLSTAWTNYDNTAQAPIALPGDGVVRLVPRHLDAETVERAQEWAEYHQQHEHHHEHGPVGAAVEDEDLRRWDDYVAACTPTLTSRREALQTLEALAKAIDTAWPSGTPRDKVGEVALLDVLADL